MLSYCMKQPQRVIILAIYKKSSQYTLDLIYEDKTYYYYYY